MSHTNSGNGHRRRVTLRIRIPRRITIRIPRLQLPSLGRAKNSRLTIKRSRPRVPIIALTAIFVLGTTYSFLSPYFEQNAYALDSRSMALLPEVSPSMAQHVSFNMRDKAFNFSPETSSVDNNMLGKPSYSSALLYQNPKEGIRVTDPVNQIDFSMTPQFELKEGRQTDDKIIYPLKNGDGWVVYTLRGNGVKEDIVLSYARDDTASYSFKLGLGNGLRAAIEQDGSLAVYGNTLLSGNIATGSDKDAELLQKARQNAQKDSLLFRVPAPVVVDRNGVAEGISSKYTLEDDILTITASGLKKGNYPISIDPSIYVVTAQQFMQGNNESNIEFDVDNKLIKKGKTTGARFNTWNTTTSLPTANWGGPSVPAGGYLYEVGGTTSGGTSATVNWSQFSTDVGTIDSPNPGEGACANWCTESEYDLPDGRAHHSLVAYNGHLYAIGGTSANCTVGNGTGTASYCDTVYIAKLGANGEPRLWHPTDPDPENWTYWYRDTDLSTERAYTGAAVYKNHIYLVGGQTSSGTSTAVSIAPVNPNGTLGTWSSSGNTVNAANAYGPSVETYNGYLYVIGGNSGPTGAPTNTTRYSKIAGDGSIGAWQQTKSFTTARSAIGPELSTVWNGYLYISGGCSAVNGSGYCTAIESDAQVASINADGSIDNWYVMPDVSDERFGHSLMAWRNRIYAVGGCSEQDPSSGACTSILSSVKYGNINASGDVSTISNSSASGVGTCVDGPPYNCDLPSASVGNVLNATAVVNGYLYIMGGCTNDACTTTSTGVTYQAIGSDGTLQRPSTCSGSFVDAYCVSSSALPTGLAASGTAIFNDMIYLVGGFGTGTNIYHTNANSDGSIGAWTTTSLATASSSAVTTLSYTYAYARANPSSAGTNPGNLYIVGGCTNADVNCTDFSQAVLKCNLNIAGVPSSCSTSGQLQIGALPSSCGTGLGAMAGTVYANYMYLIGGLSPNCSNLQTTRYAKFDNSNNIVAVSGGAWVEGANQTNTGRQRGAGFGYNGYLYVVGGYDSDDGSVLNDIEFAKINVSDGSWGAWSTSSITINQRWGLSVPVSNSYAYVVGGCTAGTAPSSCSSRTNMTQTFQLYNNNSGAPASYSTSANTFSTDPNRIGVATTILDGYIYVAGGCTSTTDYCTSRTSDVSYAAIDSYGGIGSWSSASGSLGASRAWGKLRAAGGTLYYIGGEDSTGTPQTTVYYATPSAGDISSWSTASNGLPNARSDFGSAVWNDRLYVVGGKGSGTGCSGGYCNTVYVSPSLSGGGDITTGWSTSSTSFNIARSGIVAVAYANNLYVFGGYDGNFLSDSQFAKLDPSTGQAGSWSYSQSLPQPLAQGDGFAINGYVYLVGGRSSPNICEPTSLVAPISANTTIASGNNPTGVGTWFETNQKYSGPRFGHGTAYANGKLYVLGGMNCTGGTSYSSSGNTSYVVPAGVTEITVKLWGAGGGGGGSGWLALGGNGGGGGYASSVLSVTPGETLTVSVGGGGSGGGALGSCCGQGKGGAGGGYSSILRSTTHLIIAPGGAGGGGGNKESTGGDAGAGGGASGIAGSAVGATTAGQGGTSSAGGAGGGSNGTAGSSLTGGNGGGNASGGGGGPAGSFNGGGSGGSAYNYFFPQATTSGGGGGGGGYYGGGGGGNASSNTRGGSGGGGGSSYLTGTSQTTSAGSGMTPGNSGDSFRGTAGNGGPKSPSNNGSGSAGNAGLIRITTPTSISPVTPVVQQTAVLSQPQISQYSIMLDTDTDVYPTKWLLNGIDNSIGAHWKLNYKSMTDPNANRAGNGAGMDCSVSQMTGWGQATNHGDVTLGLPGLYMAVDDDGIDTNCARFYMLNISVSAEKTFGYPDDVTRGPTITDLTVSFTADPAKRLLHGRTFINGLQMPLDTPGGQ